ncbi:hypothetical protein Tco_1549700, partial [Tanacetum coccineum]
VFEQEIQGASKTSSSAQNVAFVSQSKSITNKVKSGFSGAYSTCTPSTSSTNIPKKKLLLIDDLDIEEMDIKWQIAMIAIRMKKFDKKTGRRVRQEAPSVTQPQPSSTVVQPTPPTTQPIPSKATTIPPLSQPAPPTPIAETTTASPSPSPSPAHEPMEHTFEQPSTDQQPPTPRQEATTSQLMTRIGDLEKQLKETKQTFRKAILTLVDRVKTLEVALKRKTKRVLLSDSEEEETEAQGRKTHDLDPLVSLVQELVTPSKTVNASGEEQVEDISPTTLKAAAILTKVLEDISPSNSEAAEKLKFAGTGLDFEEVKSAFEKVNTGGVKVSSGIEEINDGSLDVNTSIDPITTGSIRDSIPSPDRGRREGKAPMIEEEETQASR